MMPREQTASAPKPLLEQFVARRQARRRDEPVSATIGEPRTVREPEGEFEVREVRKSSCHFRAVLQNR